jgi:DNA ligase D-like protein (predicted 3'-phosphoesterase)
VVQLHDATRLHYDLRLEIGGVLRSWAVPRGPSLDPSVRRLAVAVDDHSLESGEFEGVHQGQARGSGAVIIWDEGSVRIMRAEAQHLSFVLDGHKLRGRFGLTHTGGKQWVLVKADDDAARRGSDIAVERPASVRTGRTWQQLARCQHRAAPIRSRGMSRYSFTLRKRFSAFSTLAIIQRTTIFPFLQRLTLPVTSRAMEYRERVLYMHYFGWVYAIATEAAFSPFVFDRRRRGLRRLPRVGTELVSRRTGSVATVSAGHLRNGG